MLSTSNLISFVATTDPKRARAFYQKALGLKFLGDEPFALVFDANGTMLRVQKVQSLEPAAYTVLGWKVSSIRRTVAAMVKKGVTCERFAGLSQDDVGIWLSPGGAKIAWFKDPDGNILSLTEF